MRQVSKIQWNSMAMVIAITVYSSSACLVVFPRDVFDCPLALVVFHQMDLVSFLKWVVYWHKVLNVKC